MLCSYGSVDLFLSVNTETMTISDDYKGRGDRWNRMYHETTWPLLY